MKRVLGGVGFLLVVFLAYPIALRVQAASGMPVLLLFCLAFGAMATWAGHTPETLAWVEDFVGALKDAGISQKQAAIVMEIPEPTLTNYITGKEQGSFRIAKLGAKFRVAFGKRLIARDSDCAVVERQEVCDLVNAVQVLTAEMRRPWRGVA